MKYYNPYESKKDRIIKSMENKYLPNIYFKLLKTRKSIIEKIRKDINKHNIFDMHYDFMIHDRKKTMAKLNDNQKIKLTDLVIEELVEIDNPNNLVECLHNILDDFGSFLDRNTHNFEDIRLFINNAKVNYCSDSWINVGIIQFPENHELNKFIKNIQITLQSFTISHMRIMFFVELSDEYDEKITNILNNDYKDVCKVHIKKSIKKYIHLSKKNGELFRKEDIQNILLYFKWKILKTISYYIPLYFFNENIIAPSLEFFEGKNIFGRCSDKCESYLSNLGIPKGYFCDIYGYNNLSIWEIYENFYEGNFNYNSTKIILNEDAIEYEVSILSEKQSIAKEIFKALIVNTIYNNLNYDMINCKISIKKYNINKRNHKELFEIRYALEQKSILFDSIENYLENRNISIDVCTIKELLNIVNNESFINFLYEDNEMKMKSLKKDIKENKDLLDDIITLLNIRFNRTSQKITIILTFITMVLTVITVINSQFIRWIWNLILAFINNPLYYINYVLDFIKNLIAYIK